MATQATRDLATQAKHTVGNLVSTRKYIKDFANGGLYTEDVDNFHLLEGSYNPTTGEFEVKQLTDNTKDAKEIFLSAGAEVRYLPWENQAAYFNGKGDKERIVYPTQGLIFDTSAFVKDSTITKEIATGDKAHYDTAKKAFVVHNGTEGGYATATVKFTVRRAVSNILGQPTVRLVVL